MTLAMLIAGIFAFLAGILTVLWGISLKEFSLGSTFILSGTIGVCSGMLLMGLYAVVQELKGIARRLAGVMAPSEVRVRPVLPPGLTTAGMPGPEAVPAEAAKVEPTMPVSPAAPPPWQNEAVARERPRAEAPSVPEVPASPPAPEAPRRRNLLFASTSRKERERAQAKAAEVAPAEEHPAAAVPEPPEPPPSFDDTWPKPDRMRPPEPTLPRRPPPRTPSTFTEATPPPAPPPPEPRPAPPAEQPAVTVLKSGVVDGMAYSLYSDGSIEAQMPEGMMRFASIDELRTHLDQRS
ncbi:DUF308 domain-containing protein [Bradyrhizobium sp. CB82]|uniref:DUF308 domain-containing protein n=1 Tax=Bradyrhizobium sp. CB82 TaxID=3039159 RepID=UPI0024B12419|nr:DUF308 domain-containing protein [Bradyrhizobium sp. CB82]WFU38472.1 DUF308 domain-containing protein [Bradyrhizobium sp. CB82]